VGGFVRDALLGRASHDLDLTVRGDALAVARMMAEALEGAFIPLDEGQRVARVAFQRQEQAWHVDLATQQGDLRQDLLRRDFTVDAMAAPLGALLGPGWPLQVVDPCGGREDLVRRLIRQTSPTVFQEDGLRLLRAVRLSVHLGFQIEPATRESIRQNAVCLGNVAWERIRDEFLGILACQKAMGYLYELDDLDLLCRVLPELADGKGVAQPKEHYWDVFRHNLETVGTVEGLLLRTYQPAWALEGVPWDSALASSFGETVGEGHSRATLLKLAGLLHDIAKPAARTVEASGRIRFFGHHTQGALMARAAMERLRLGRRAVRMVEAMVEHHLRPGQMRQGVEMPTPKAVYRYFRDAGEVAIDTLYLNLADYLSARGPLLEQKEWAEYTTVIGHILESSRRQQEPSSARLLDGHDLMSALDLSPGPAIGRLLEALGEAQATGEIATREEALALAKRIIASDPEAHHA
jgi:poly(A) polymerase